MTADAAPTPPPTAPTTSAGVTAEPPPAGATAKPATADADGKPKQWRASVRWGGYVLVMIGLLGLGYVFTKSWLWPKFIMPAWMWALMSGWHGEAFYSTAVVLASGMVGDAADMLLVRGRRLLARLAILLMIVALAVLAVWSWRHGHYLVAIMAALMATVGPLARRAWPGLPRAQIRKRRPPPR